MTTHASLTDLHTAHVIGTYNYARSNMAGGWEADYYAKLRNAAMEELERRTDRAAREWVASFGGSEW